ncbi:family 10 glycosylhydrolase [Chroococcidiopsis sp. CCMEE 29]|uniref:family 10 glycosylhydrolase n=1 Tax=Chroococcidiopsis sp. CCMEE 29 TaxID=155894 RepID=UPI0020204568|nr:family 10 glycosylhydrolase [Chroococcidiopsis sp. CCMEE 29]
MLIKLDFSALLLKLSLQEGKSKSHELGIRSQKKISLWVPGCLFLAFNFLLFPASVRAEQAVLGVVKSEENANQWTEITSRLRVAGVPYCVIELPTVRSAADLSDRPVVFLPNIETITPAQAIALEEWMSRGGRVIASGPVGNLSQPGVRQLLRSLLGAYWGFNLSTPSNLQPLRTNTQEWVRQAGNDGVVLGGVVIPTGINSKPAAIWQSKDNPPAVVTTDRSTVLGWQWGVNAAAPVELDTAWLRAAISRYTPLAAAGTTTADSTAELPKNCNGTVASATLPPAPQPTTPLQNTANSEITPPAPPAPQVAVAPKPRAIPNARPPQPDDLIEQLAPPGLEVAPDSKQPLTGVQASALKQELENLIGRFESAQLAANAINSKRNEQHRRNDRTEVATANPLKAGLLEPAAKAVAEAREIAKSLPQLIAQKDYAAARQQWLKAQQLLRQHYPIDRTLAQPEIRAMWLDRGSIVRAGSEQGLAKIFDQLAAAGINTVFFETVNAGYPIYPSEVAPQQNPLVRGWDPLAAAVKLAHERGMELHAWVWTFAVGNQRHNAIVNLPADYPGPVIAAHPEWASYDNRGSLFPPGQGKPFLDPANPAARQYLFRLVNEIVSRYQVDGLQLDYIRYPFQDPSAERSYGYGIAARQQFQQMTGVDPTNIRPGDRQLWQKWTEFRTRQIDSFVADVSQRLRQKRPNLIMSVAVFPLSEHDRIHKLQQHWEVWANRGDVDLIVPMTYAQDTYRFQRLAQPWIASTKLGSALILPGIRLLNLPVLEAIDQIQLARDLPVSGYSLFAVENLSNELQTIFHNTQGSDSNLSQTPVPYRQPFQTAAARYAALQGEWNFLLENNQLWLRGSALSAFNTQAKEIESALNQLSKDPSPSRLVVARAALTAFQSQFKEWMRPQALENPYQVNVWQNRLATLDRLLSYGERVVLKRESPPVAEQP